jgi:hypothetical protein
MQSYVHVPNLLHATPRPSQFWISLLAVWVWQLAMVKNRASSSHANPRYPLDVNGLHLFPDDRDAELLSRLSRLVMETFSYWGIPPEGFEIALPAAGSWCSLVPPLQQCLLPGNDSSSFRSVGSLGALGAWISSPSLPVSPKRHSRSFWKKLRQISIPMRQVAKMSAMSAGSIGRIKGPPYLPSNGSTSKTSDRFRVSKWLIWA